MQSVGFASFRAVLKIAAAIDYEGFLFADMRAFGRWMGCFKQTLR